MNLPYFLAHRIYAQNDDKRKVSRPAIRIATIGVAIGLAVMIVSVCVVLGMCSGLPIDRAYLRPMTIFLASCSKA